MNDKTYLHNKSFFNCLLAWSLRTLAIIILLLTTLWAALVLWVHLNDHSLLRWLAVISLSILSLIVIVMAFKRKRYWQQWLIGFSVLWLAIFSWFVWLPPQQDKQWQAEVERLLSYDVDQQNPNLLTLHNVRNFDWRREPGSEKLIQPQKPYFHRAVDISGKDEVVNDRWISRTIDLSKLSGVDIINSYWMGEQIGHTLLSFRFEDDRPLSFSIEIRKEEDESFSTVGGFVKQFEMAVVASEERDIVYTRSNVRGEQVYMFPIKGMSNEQVQRLFTAYLDLASELQKEAKWYNTLIRNCTTVLFDMARQIDAQLFPWDYRILLSGYVPDYLFDEGLLPNSAHSNSMSPVDTTTQITDEQSPKWSIEEWYTHAHINPKVSNFDYEDNQDPQRYSQLIRQGLPEPKLVKNQ